jgi:hypothetical protein
MSLPVNRVTGIVILVAGLMSLGGGSAARAQDPLLKQVDQGIEISKKRYLTAGLHTPWQILHGILAYRGDYEVKDSSGKLMNAVEWMSRGQSQDGQPWFEKTQFGGRAHPYTKDYVFEGHPNQFLAMMANADFPKEHKLTGGDSPITVGDLVDNAKKETNSREEITWTLWSLSHYLGPDATWTNKNGESWSIERLVSIQSQASTSNAACGGTHAMYALAYSLKTYKKTNRPLRGVWLEADRRVQQYVAIAQSMQNADGSFSSQYFKGRGYSREFDKRLSTSGHTLEFLMLALPKKRLGEEWVRKGIASVANDLIANKGVPAEPGALYHAIDALVLYRQRMTGEAPRFVSKMKAVPAPVKARKPDAVKSAKRPAGKIKQTGASNPAGKR